MMITAVSGQARTGWDFCPFATWGGSARVSAMDGAQAGSRASRRPQLGLAETENIVRAALERAETAHRRSAARLRGNGHADLARSIEQRAARVRFDLDEPAAARRLYATAARLRRVSMLQPLAYMVLDELLSLAHADRGNVQLADPDSGELRIIAHYGFDREFLDYFAVVADDGSACGRAARHGTQLVIRDVNDDSGFKPHREIAAASGFRAVLSTPLLDGANQVVGVLSTHYPRCYAPPAMNLRIIQRYADLTARILAARLRAG